ncbi:MAG: hypothetical protein ABSH13_09480 [Candidatus Acidiferrum sp.]|jgi:hypothetical protein
MRPTGNDDRDLLTVLKAELEFLEKGGYQPSPDAPWRPQFLFEDSPTCLNHGKKENRRPCGECILMKFVPQDCRDEQIPCRHIPLNAQGYSIDTYYRLGIHEEVEAALAAWLRKMIEQQARRPSNRDAAIAAAE